jgi:uncharacterized SAM-binding protein YcdF (DUF218 family)
MNRRALKRTAAALVATSVLYFTAIQIWLPRNETPTGTYDAVVVLGADVLPDSNLNADGAMRLRRGIEVARDTKAPIITSRVIGIERPNPVSDVGQRRILDSAGYIGSFKILDGVALTTRDEAERLKRVLPVGRIALVTSRLHTRRACAVFERAGYSVTCVSAGMEVPWWKGPYKVLYESAAHVKYRYKGWI